MSSEALVAQYLECLQSEGKTPYTIQWHRHALRWFVSWLKSNGLSDDPGTWSPAILRNYINYNQTRTTRFGKPLSG